MKKTRAEVGSIEELAPGRWRIRVSAGYDPKTGTRIRLSRTIRGAKKDALAERTRMQIASGDVVRGARDMTIAQYFVELFLPDKQRLVGQGKYARTTYAALRQYADVHIIPKIGHIKLSKMTTYQLDSWAEGIEGPSAAWCAYAHFKNAWNQARAWGIVPRDHDIFFSAHGIPKPKPDVVAATPEQLSAILVAFRGHRLEPALLLMAGCGLRLSEALAVNWDDIDFINGRVSVTGSYHRVDGVSYFAPTKTSASAAAVSIPKDILARLAARRPEVGEALCPAANQSRLYPQYAAELYRKHFRKMLPEQEFIKMKNLRHTHATILLSSGVDIALVSKRLRHTSLSTTMSFYIKPEQSVDEQVGAAFNDAVFRASARIIDYDEACSRAQRGPKKTEGCGSTRKNTDGCRIAKL